MARFGFKRRAKVEFNSINLVRHSSRTAFETGLGVSLFPLITPNKNDPTFKNRLRVKMKALKRYFWEQGWRSGESARQCGLGSIPGPGVICGLSLLLVLSLLREVFLRVLRSSSHPLPPSPTSVAWVRFPDPASYVG